MIRSSSVRNRGQKVYLTSIMSQTPIAWRRDRRRSALFVSTPGYTVLDPADCIQTFLCSPSTVDSVQIATLRTGYPLAFACDPLVHGNSALVLRRRKRVGIARWSRQYILGLMYA